LPDEAATQRLGKACAACAANGLVLHLRGELGAGKTTLVRGLLRALGYQGRVKSPTYTLVEPYGDLRLNLYHFDLYRLKDPSEWLSSGFREHFNADSLCVVEWPERAGNLIAKPDLDVHLEYTAGNESRRAALRAHTRAGETWLSSALSHWRSS